MESSVQPSTFASRGTPMRGAQRGATRGRRSRSERLRRLLERRRFERFQHLPYGESPLGELARDALDAQLVWCGEFPAALLLHELEHGRRVDRKSTRLNSSHSQISYAVFCLKKKKQQSARVLQIKTRTVSATPSRSGEPGPGSSWTRTQRRTARGSAARPATVTTWHSTAASE